MAPQRGGTGFDQYQSQNNGGNANTAPSGQYFVTSAGAGQPESSLGGPGFPSSFGKQSYPGLSSKQLALMVSDGQPTLTGKFSRELSGDGRPEVASYQTVQQLMDIFFQRSQSDPEAIAQLQDSLILGGYLDPRNRSYTPGGVVQPGDATWDAYAHLLLDSVRLKQGWSDLLNSKVNAGDGEKRFNLSQTEDQVHISNPQEARATLADVMTRRLGRQPTNAEIGSFAAQLASVQQANPTETTTNVDLSSMLNSSTTGPQKATTVTTSGGSNADVEADNFLMQNDGKELAQTNADGAYQLFLSMLNGAGGL